MMPKNIKNIPTQMAEKIKLLTTIGISLSTEDNKDKLLEKILYGAKKLTNANAGTLYLLTDQQELKIETLLNDQLNLVYGGTSGINVPFAPVPLYIDDQPNHANVVSHAVLINQTINIADAYHENGFNFVNTRKIDQQTGYHSQSFLTVPLNNHQHKIIGVLQLINCQDESGNIIPFDHAAQELAEALAAQAAVTLTMKELLAMQQQLFADFIQMLAKTIDNKSHYTSGHCARVAEIALMLAEALNRFNKDELHELNIASLLHDCGKITTPEHIMDKTKKLEAITDRIELINLRLDIFALKKQLELTKNNCTIKEYEAYITILEQDKLFLQQINTGENSLSKTDKENITNIAKKYPGLLTKDEINNLQIEVGTLNTYERQIIDNHAAVTLEMLQSLHFPDNLKNVAEIAGSHHEHVDGNGYPRKLKLEKLSVQARILAIADIFEALTSVDRPYRKATKKLSVVLKVLDKMSQTGHVDPELWAVFMDHKIYLKYAKQYLKPEQIDHE